MTSVVQDIGARLAVESQLRAGEVLDTLHRQWKNPAERTSAFYAWVLLVGVLVIAAAAAWATCRARGYRGFSGGVRLAKGPWGVTIGISLECY